MCLQKDWPTPSRWDRIQSLQRCPLRKPRPLRQGEQLYTLIIIYYSYTTLTLILYYLLLILYLLSVFEKGLAGSESCGGNPKSPTMAIPPAPPRWVFVFYHRHLLLLHYSHTLFILSPVNSIPTQCGGKRIGRLRGCGIKYKISNRGHSACSTEVSISILPLHRFISYSLSYSHTHFILTLLSHSFESLSCYSFSGVWPNQWLENWL